MYKNTTKMNIIFIIILVIVLVCATEICASPIQEEQANKTNGANVAEINEGAQSASEDIVLEAMRDIVYDSSADMGIIEKYNQGLPLENNYSTEEINILNEYIDNLKRAGKYPLDRFPEIMKRLEIPKYTLAEDFPKEHIKTFNDFLLFCASIVVSDYEEPSILLSKGYLYGYEARAGVVYEHPLVKMRLKLNNPVQYEDFLAAIPLSICLRFPGRYYENRDALCGYYMRMFMYQSRNSLFIENILKPLCHDLSNGKYRGFRFKSNELQKFIKDFVDNCYDRRLEAVHRDEMFFINGRPYTPFRFIAGRPIHPFTLVLPEEFYLLNYYAQTFLLVHQGELSKAYKILYRYKMPRNPYNKIPSNVSYNPFKSGVTPSYIYRLLPPRPYYYYSDDDRYQWFSYLQEEMRSAGYFDYADIIMETEIEHYRELIVWQLKLRAYLTGKLYEYGDSANLLTLKELLTSEYTSLKNDPLFQTIFENAIEALRDLDDKVQATSPIDTAKGEVILPWIDREAIDRKQGIETEVLSPQQNQITWRIAKEEIDDETKEEMKNSYENAIYYIRVLAVISERLNQENDLETMVQLHSKLASNTNVNCTPTGIYHQVFRGEKNTKGDGEKNQTLDSQTGLYPRYYQSNTLSQPASHRLSFIEKDTIKDSEDISEIELNEQTKFDQRRYDLIVNDFWGWQARRKNGDMSVGEIILPWIAVQEK